MRKDAPRLDGLRRECAPVANGLIDALAAGRVSRRDFVRHGAAIGLSLRLLGAVAGSLGLAAAAPRRAKAAATGGVIRVGQLVPQMAIEPVKVTEAAGIAQLSLAGEYLCLNGADLVLAPMLAESWSPNADATLWSFKLRQGVKFHDGKPMTADDVVATFERLTDPDYGSNALTLFSGYLSLGGTKKADAATIEFHLDAPHGNFPYLVSSDNYNAIILPADYRGDFESNFIATGPFKLEKYTLRTGSSFVRNDDYWGGKALADRIECAFFADTGAQADSLKAGQIDIIQQLPVRFGAQLSGEAGIEILGVPSGSHHQVHMRTDMEPFADPRVRRAVALCLDRPSLIQSLAGGHARVGNDSPIAPAYPFAAKTVPQRERNIGEAKQLMEAAGKPEGFGVTLVTEKFLEIPDFARAIQDAVKTIGGRIEIEALDQGAYYADGVFGKSPWLDSAMGITDFGHRGLPNVSLTAALGSDGAWNAARYRNPAYDRLVSSYIGALDIEAQRQAAAQIETLLLQDTPVVFAYFHDALMAVRKGVTGVKTTAMGHLLLAEASAPK